MYVCIINFVLIFLMYVCMYVCIINFVLIFLMYVCTYVCMYASAYAVSEGAHGLASAGGGQGFLPLPAEEPTGERTEAKSAG